MIGFITAYFFEKPARHAQLVSFMLPKALETLAGVLARKGVFKKRSWHEGAVLLLVWAIIALTALLDYKKSQ